LGDGAVGGEPQEFDGAAPGAGGEASGQEQSLIQGGAGGNLKDAGLGYFTDQIDLDTIGGEGGGGEGFGGGDVEGRGFGDDQGIAVAEGKVLAVVPFGEECPQVDGEVLGLGLAALDLNISQVGVLGDASGLVDGDRHRRQLSGGDGEGVGAGLVNFSGDNDLQGADFCQGQGGNGGNEEFFADIGGFDGAFGFLESQPGEGELAEDGEVDGAVGLNAIGAVVFGGSGEGEGDGVTDGEGVVAYADGFCTARWCT